MSINTFKVCDQIYIIPFVKITHDRALNGDLELIIGWLNRGISFSI